MVVASLYDPITEIAPVWWLFNFLVVDGMVICLFIPYRNIFKFLLWYVYLSMIFVTFILSLIIIRVIISYMNGELSALYLYENAMLEPLLGLIQELANLTKPLPICNYIKSPFRLKVRTLLFQGTDTGSIPVRDMFYEI